ncbi:hypothetical protein AVT22_gp30 [Streptomyces phage Caliburn]|uniref:Uncharacterized protein n=1 Tax=Streptomyces phage Caliburn TaxID=1690425 RepID=A0A0K1Y8A3_9CAUD|nr:hypothetical protein AVT22_gp30 [Streptomyces phage Caliburn]AKY03340.1 hypothetical protein SEA_CALIBURN_30 [Streptomyces phage Caliburn]
MAEPHLGQPASAELPMSYATDRGRIVIRLDFDGFDFHIVAYEGYTPSLMKSTLSQLDRLGLATLGDEDRDPEILECGGVRIYLAPRRPVNNTAEFLESITPEEAREISPFQRSYYKPLEVVA